LIIRGEKVTQIATLSGVRTLHFEAQPMTSFSFVDEECKKAHQKGREEGEKCGYEHAILEIFSLVQVLQRLAHALWESKRSLLEQIKPEVVEFAICVCERMIRKELQEPETLVKLISSLLSYATSKMQGEALILILSTEDYVMLEKHLMCIHYDQRDIKGITFRSDPLMKRGDCRIDSPTSLLDYTIARQLADLQSKVLQG
jgi:flagellar biosynthesis/type III secretory pathway protein FliH